MANDHPSGVIADELEGHGRLAEQYFNFLRSVDPIERWEQVVPLEKPIEIDDEYSIDWDIVARMAAVCPQLAGVMAAVGDQTVIAPKLGLRYAWSRFVQHVHLLDAIELLFDQRGIVPSLVFEPGCSTGGLLQFLATHWDQVAHIGFDISSTALKICGQLSDQLRLPTRPIGLEADFAQIRPADLPDGLGDKVAGGLVIMANVIEHFGQQFARYPYLEPWEAKAGVVSYWVNQGATVLLCERHEQPETLLQTIVEEARWGRPGCTARILADFEAYSTTDMIPENPLGSWTKDRACVLVFLPPESRL